MNKQNKILLAFVASTLTFASASAVAFGQRIPQPSQPETPAPMPTPLPSLPATYEHLDPQGMVPRAALNRLVQYYDQVKAKLKNPYYITVIDFAKHSSQKRMFVIDIRTGAVTPYLVAHGKGSERNPADDDGYADRFSNVSGSNASSLGIYRTGEQIVSGKHGTAMLLNGLEATNSNALAREIIIHGAWYVSPDVVSETGRIGRSQGCPAVEDRYIDGLVKTLKNGSLLIIAK
jgi:L,D-transpeptidase catalytic domain